MNDKSRFDCDDDDSVSVVMFSSRAKLLQVLLCFRCFSRRNKGSMSVCKKAMVKEVLTIAEFREMETPLFK